ncbi:MAG TPA: hypothetical protein VEF72_24010 [Mycobacterium sp.]|nr:hypothetical protein [Mycobacterium sp.]
MDEHGDELAAHRGPHGVDQPGVVETPHGLQVGKLAVEYAFEHAWFAATPSDPKASAVD